MQHSIRGQACRQQFERLGDRLQVRSFHRHPDSVNKKGHVIPSLIPTHEMPVWNRLQRTGLKNIQSNTGVRIKE